MTEAAANRDVNSPDVLQQSLPDPEQFVPDEYADRDRAVATLAVDSEIGRLRFGSDGADGTVTAIGGYVAADALGADGSWDGRVDPDAKLIGTSVVDDVDALAFTPESFSGVAVRATRAIDLYVDGVLVIAGVDMVRYATDRGVFGATVYRPEVAGNWRMFQIGPRNTGSRAPVGSPPTEGFAEAWEEPFTTDGEMFSSPAVVDGTVYVGSNDNNVYALDAATGDFQWGHTIGSAATGSPAVVDETVYACSEQPDEAVYALDAAAGDDEDRRKWRVPLEGTGWDPVVADGTVYVGSDGGTVVAINAASGDVDWRKSPGEGSEYGTPAVRDGTVFVQGDGALHALDADSGDPLDSVPGAGTEYSVPAIADGVVYVAADRTVGGVVYAVDAESTETQWNVELSDRPRSPVAVADGTVYLGTDAGVVYAVEQGNAREFFSFDTDDEVFSGPTVVDDVVYVGSPAGFLYALDRETGESLGRIDTEGAVQSSPAVADGTVHVGVGGIGDSPHYSVRAYTASDGGGDQPEGSGDALFRQTFEEGLGGWNIGPPPHRDLPDRNSPGEGSWSEEHGGSARLHVDGAPSTVTLHKKVGAIPSGTEITASYEPTQPAWGYGNVVLDAITHDGETTRIDIDNEDPDRGGASEQDGQLSGTVPEDLPEGTHLFVKLVVWPGEATVWVKEIAATR